jgi:uncharacterized protein
MLERNTIDPDAKKLERRPMSIAFGLERIGLIAIRAPILSCIILLAMVIGAVFGIERIKIDDSLSQLFRSNSKEYRQYEAVTKRFPSTEYDVLVVVEGKTLLQRANLEKLRDLVTDLQLVEGTRGLISLFSARARLRRPANCRRRYFRRSCRRAPTTTNSSRRSKPTRSSAASCCRKTARWR